MDESTIMALGSLVIALGSAAATVLKAWHDTRSIKGLKEQVSKLSAEHQKCLRENTQLKVRIGVLEEKISHLETANNA